MRFEFWHPAGTFTVPGKGEFPERFGPHAFDHLVNRTVPWRLRQSEGGPVLAELGQATVIAVAVADDGSGAMFLVEISGDPLTIGPGPGVA